MSQPFQNTHIQVLLPKEDGLRSFPLDTDTRFSDLFRTLIAQGHFSVFGSKNQVWVLLCGNQDLVTWNAAANTFFDRFPFGEPPIVSVPHWTGQMVRFVSYPDPMSRAKSIYLYFRGSKFFMGHEGFLPEYKSYKVPPALETRWRAECGDFLSKR